MIENARNQFILVLLVAIAAVWYAFHEPTLGVDLRGGVQLIYEVPEERVKAAVLESQNRGNPIDETQVMADTIAIIADRADPTGTQDVNVVQRGDYGILIELPTMSDAEAAEVRARIERLGKLEMRIVASNQYGNENDEGVSFNLENEQKRLEDWLALEDHRARAMDDPVRTIELFNRLPAEQGGAEASPHLKWRVHRVRPDFRDGAYWDYVMASNPQGGVVPLFDMGSLSFDQEQRKHRRDETVDELLEFIPINWHAEYFQGQDLNANGVFETIDPKTGDPAVSYTLLGEKETPYGDWSAKYLGQASAIILNNEVRSAPVFQGAIRGGQGQISGGFTSSEVAELVRVLKTGSLKVEPRLQSSVVIGATLGEAAIDRGLYSIAIGGALVLAFILAYYRVAGLVAFIAIAFNVLLIWGVLQFTRATLTLPGIAGMVLTMGMAIDANILIYERIREELRGGKELLQAVRSGFEKAMVAILDSNITTFLAGVVLYNVGVGPIKGFAVTLMVGILTTLFTAFFVTRLVFHWLLAKEMLHDFKVGGWLQNAKYGFLKLAKPAFMLSIVAVIVSLVYALTADRDKILGLDFTGGANLQMVMKEPMTAQEIRQNISENAAFKERFREPSVNTLGDVSDDEAARRFNLKIKLDADERVAIDQERQQAQDSGTNYVTPYVGMLQEIFAEELVPPAFSNPVLSPGDDAISQAAYIELHFATDVRLEEIRGKLAEANLPDLRVRAAGGEAGVEVARDVLVEWTAGPDQLESELFSVVRTALDAHRTRSDGSADVDNDNRLRDAAGDPVLLSSPFPEATELGGRMVGELQNAAIGAMILSLFLIVMYIRVRFHEYKYGLAAVAALAHDVMIALGAVTLCTSMEWVDAELSLPMIAAFLTIVGYSINDTIIIFDRIRENLGDNTTAGVKEEFGALVNRSINQTLSRTILTSGTTMFVVLAQFVVNYRSGSDLEGFSFALIIGILSGTYSTIFIACPILVWLRTGETDAGVIKKDESEEDLKEGDDEFDVDEDFGETKEPEPGTV